MKHPLAATLVVALTTFAFSEANALPANPNALYYDYNYTGSLLTGTAGPYQITFDLIYYIDSSKNLNGTYALPDGNSFFVGPTSYWSGDVTFSHGTVIGWNLSEFFGVTYGQLLSTSSASGGSFIQQQIGGPDLISINSTPGTWSVRPSFTPLPAALPAFWCRSCRPRMAGEMAALRYQILIPPPLGH